MKPPSVEDSLVEPNKPHLGARIAKNLHIVGPAFLLSLIGVVLIFQANEKDQAQVEPTVSPTEEEIKGRSQIDRVAPDLMLAQEIAAQRKAAEDERLRREAQKPPAFEVSENLPPVPGAGASMLPPIPQGRPGGGEVDQAAEKARIRQEQIRQSQIIALAGKPSATGKDPRGPAEVDPAVANTPQGRIAQMRAEAAQLRQASQAQQDQIIMASRASSAAPQSAPMTATRTAAQSSRNPNEAWLERQQAQSGSSQVIGLDAARAGPVIHQGVIIPAVLLTALNSDLPGQISALVSMDVYDSVRGNNLMIPKGSKLIGQYNSDIRIGQERMMAAFTRIIRPDGSSINLAGMPGADQIGQAGLQGDVNNHFWKMFSSSFLIAGVSWLFDKNSDNTVVVNNSTTQTPTEMTGEILKDVSKTILDRNTTIQPTITIEKGQKLNVVVNKDISIPAYSPR